MGDNGQDARHREEDDDNDELRLRWAAAIERLPTIKRLRTSLQKCPGEGANGNSSINMVDVTKLRDEDRHRFIQKIIKNVKEDNHDLLEKLKERITKVGLKLPSVEVRYRNLSVEARRKEFAVSKRGVKSKQVQVSILKDVSGIIKPSRMTLLLGPPGSGKSTLLLSLAGKVREPLKVKGDLTYNGFKLDEFVPQKTSSYISQHDLHIPEMTVREILDFSLRFQGVGSRADIMAEVTRREKQEKIFPELDLDTYMKGISVEGLRRSLQTDYILKILGLENCSETKVGDALRRGISGGQRKRLTTGEMIVGPARTFFMDEISNGLDSSTTFQVISCIQQMVHITDATSLISLLQPAPEIFNLFDDIILMSEGKIVYHGPREIVLDFFEECGFKCPQRKGVADFLQEVVSKKDQSQYWYRTDISHRYINANKFSEMFKSSSFGKKLEEELLQIYEKSQSDEKALVFSQQYLTKWELLRTCMDREILLMKRDSIIYISKLCQIMVVAIITMTVFLRTEMEVDLKHSGNYTSSLYFTITRIMANGIEELSLSVIRLPVFYKQRDLLFYPAWAYTIPISMLKIPLSLAESLIWTATTYFVIGYSPEPQRFFRQLLLLFALHQTSISLFRFLASVAGKIHKSALIGNLSLIAAFMFGGFILPHNSFPAWLHWMFWLSPATHAEIGLSLTEFRAPRWQKLLSGTTTLGEHILKTQGLDFKNYFYWISVGALFGFTVLLNVGITMALTYLKSPETSEANATIQQPFMQQEREHSEIFTHSESMTNKGPDRTSTQIKGKVVIPFKPLSMTFKDVQYFIDAPKEMSGQRVEKNKLQLLQDITGAFRPGILTALMGVTGAGKTTFMDVLCGRKTGIIEGEIKIGGFAKVQETFARVTGYCEQNDIHSPNLTVQESVIFSAYMRLPSHIDQETRVEFVEVVLETIELDTIRDSIVGKQGVSGLSTEQRKRLTIAVELVANPSIIFMDEPTSGLDARAAAIVMRVIKNIAQTGRTAVCTIHQPSIEIFESFDELLLMKKGGQMIYFGPLGHNSRNLIEYFEIIPGIPKMEDNNNPATWMLEVTSANIEQQLGIDFAQVYKESSLYENNMKLVEDLSIPTPGTSALHFTTCYPQNRWCQFKACFWKLYLSYWRSSAYNSTRLIFLIVISIMFAILLYEKGTDLKNDGDLHGIMGSMHLALVFLGIMNCSGVLSMIFQERIVLYRERSSGMYSYYAYSLAQVAIEIPCALFFTASFVLLTYPTIGYYMSASKIICYCYIVFCMLLCFTYLGMFIMSITSYIQVASIVASALYTVINLFSGFWVPKPRIPSWWIWMYWLCPSSWALKGLVTSQYGDVTNKIAALGETKTVVAFLRDHYDFHTDQMIVVMLVMACYPLLFASLFSYCIARLNFQRK